MNRNYKVIWNASLNCFMAVSEYAKARGKSSKSSVSANATINTTSNLSSIVKELINRHTAIRNKRTVCQRNLAAIPYVFV